MKSRTIITTSALPYANGSIHLGHLVEYLQTDFWVRFQKMRGHQCLYICADDAHGTAIMLRARKEKITSEELIAKSFKEHTQDFKDFGIEFDEYSTTHSPVNKDLVQEIFKSMQKGGHIDVRKIQQTYCEHDKIFLPDRFVKGVCPKCNAKDQYGDSCDQCGATYATTDLKEARCAVCGELSSKKESDHIFFKLNDFRNFLKEWIKDHTQEQIANKLGEWFDQDLRDWDISRDSPYFGFEIPSHPGKYFYVWVDAPVGYMSTTKIWCEKNNIDFKSFWNGEETEIYHFIGKDIIYFHSLFWPAMLKSAEYKTPNHIFAHGFLTVNGEKMSKSKGTFISARTYLDHLDPEYLRYYYACKLRGIDDIDLSLDDFVSRVNSDLVGKITNLGSRSAQLLNKKLDSMLSEPCEEGRELIKKVQAQADEVARLYENLEFLKALTLIRDMADEANRYFDLKAPWKIIKEDEEGVKRILTTVLNIFRVLSVYLTPILPSYSKKVSDLFGEQSFLWDSSQNLITFKKIQPYEHLITRIDNKSVEAIVEASKAN